MESRFWIDDNPDQGPSGWVGIVDEETGGIIVYVHPLNADRIIKALESE